MGAQPANRHRRHAAGALLALLVALLSTLDPPAAYATDPSTARTTTDPARRLSGVTAIAANTHRSMALRSDGTVVTWGANWAGQLGDGTTTARTVPAPVCAVGRASPCDDGRPRAP